MTVVLALVAMIGLSGLILPDLTRPALPQLRKSYRAAQAWRLRAIFGHSLVAALVTVSVPRITLGW